MSKRPRAVSPDPSHVSQHAIATGRPTIWRHAAGVAKTHLLVGWWSLVLFVALGIALETMHGLKIGWYLDVGNENRRLLWTLAHAHGALLGLVHISFAWSVLRVPSWHRRWRRVASRCLVASGALVPLGFLLGGVFLYEGQTGLVIAVVPGAAILLLISVLLLAIASGFRDPSSEKGGRKG